jgi:hypothetical protein
VCKPLFVLTAPRTRQSKEMATNDKLKTAGGWDPETAPCKAFGDDVVEIVVGAGYSG